MAKQLTITGKINHVNAGSSKVPAGILLNISHESGKSLAIESSALDGFKGLVRKSGVVEIVCDSVEALREAFDTATNTVTKVPSKTLAAVNLKVISVRPPKTVPCVQGAVHPAYQSLEELEAVEEFTGTDDSAPFDV
jgi:hypothetical protein